MLRLIFTLLTYSLVANGATLNVSVYYESLCPDSIRFITTQLYPTYQNISDYLNVELVPYGKAHVINSDDGTVNFTCQHGPNECYGNQMHACAISLKPENALEFVNCAMASDDASDDTNLQQCASEADISWTDIQECFNDGTGSQLFIENGQLTDSVKSPLEIVPTIVLDGRYLEDLQNTIASYFRLIVCILLDDEPEACHSI